MGVELCGLVDRLSMHFHASLSAVHLQALYRQKKFDSALKVLNQAIQINKSNHIPKFHKAMVLESLGRTEVCQLEECIPSCCCYNATLFHTHTHTPPFPKTRMHWLN